MSLNRDQLTLVRLAVSNAENALKQLSETVGDIIQSLATVKDERAGTVTFAELEGCPNCDGLGAIDVSSPADNTHIDTVPCWVCGGSGNA